ncbi:MAG: hydrogenase maturation protease [Gemmataceae bacterium]
MARVLVAGLGSPHGDDQVGWVVAGQLGGIHAEVQALALREPVTLLDHLGRCERLIVVDACRGGGPPGLSRRLHWPLEGRPAPLRSSHGFDVLSLLKLAESLGRLPPVVVIFAVEADSCQPGEGLSPAVCKALPRLVAAIRREAFG